MAYIWKNYSTEKKYRIASVGISPYLEVWDTEEENIPVNIYIRLYEILVPAACLNLIDERDIAEKINHLLALYEDDGRYQDIMNVLLHYIAQTDLKRGLTAQDFEARQICREIKKGNYGKPVRDLYTGLTQRDQIILARYLAKYDMANGREMQMDAALKAIFEEVNIYYEKSANTMHVYINQEKTDYNVELFWLICFFLKDIDMKVDVLWKQEHFGIIGVDETMLIDQIALF